MGAGSPAIGPIGALARVVAGVALILYELLVRDPRWQDPLLGLVVLPAVALIAARIHARHAARPLRATGPIGHALNVAIFVPLAFIPATAGGATLFYGASMLVAAVRRNGGCEVTALSNALLRRDDQVGCVLFAPIDAAERAIPRSRVGPSRRSRRRTASQ
jgi:hypothetical protein